MERIDVFLGLVFSILIVSEFSIKISKKHIPHVCMQIPSSLERNNKPFVVTNDGHIPLYHNPHVVK